MPNHDPFDTLFTACFTEQEQQAVDGVMVVAYSGGGLLTKRLTPREISVGFDGPPKPFRTITSIEVKK